MLNIKQHVPFNKEASKWEKNINQFVLVLCWYLITPNFSTEILFYYNYYYYTFLPFFAFFLFLFIFMVTCTSQSTMLFLGDLYFMIILAILKKKNLFICLYALLFVIRTVFYSNSGSSKKLFVGTLPMRLLTPTKNLFLCELTKLSNTVICSLHCLSQ